MMCCGELPEDYYLAMASETMQTNTAFFPPQGDKRGTNWIKIKIPHTPCNWGKRKYKENRRKLFKITDQQTNKPTRVKIYRKNNMYIFDYYIIIFIYYCHLLLVAVGLTYLFVGRCWSVGRLIYRPTKMNVKPTVLLKITSFFINLFCF